MKRMRAALALLAAALLLPACRPATKITDRARGNAGDKRVIVIGADGLDPRLCERLMDAGELPNLDALRKTGGYSPLGTSTPPQSPVAWANFITGADPGVHGIFDFVHRDPAKQFSPYYSASQTIESDDGWDIGEHRIPLAFWPFNHNPTQTLLRREGTPFWHYLDAAAIPSQVYDIPSNYPPTPSQFGWHCCLCGMGVPDLMGSYGTYQAFSPRNRDVTNDGGGLRKPLVFKGHTAVATLTGPTNTLLRQPEPAEIEFTVHRHPLKSLARIEIQGQTIVLRAGEWSDWIRVDFDLRMPPFLPDEHVGGICRFFLQEVRPTFRLYVTPINIDPSDPGELQLSEPREFVTRISSELGLFYTTGFQEDHKARTNRVFTDEEYLAQANAVLDERLRLLDYALTHYETGLLFFYFSSTDLQAHIFWWDGDEKHPVRDPDAARKYNGVVADLYRRIDGVIGDIVRRFGDRATILVMSDHGFANFRRQFNLNTWLRDNGYIQPPDCDNLLFSTTGHNVDWSRTRAYGLGLNGLYLNLRGREREGIVEPAERDRLLEELRTKLLAVRDVDGEQVISQVYRADEVYRGPMAEKAPDLIVGYRRGWRCSWTAMLGEITPELLSDNDSAWSADHCMATDEVPGVIFSNRPIRRAAPSLVDVAPTILAEFGVPRPDTMTGGSLFEPADATLAVR